MCGILGLCLNAGKIEENIFLDALNLMHHRGPDAEGVHVNSSKTISLGFKRLSIIDLSDHANQPFYSPCKNFILIFNGEIYNFKYLKKQLINKGYIFSTNSDSEVLLNSYIEWGNKCLDTIKGMFAFAILDMNKNEIFLARDFAGEKPLYYSDHNGCLYFSSELKPIIYLNGNLKKLNSEQIINYFSAGYVSGDSSIFSNIQKLPPAHSLTYNLQTRVKIIHCHRVMKTDTKNCIKRDYSMNNLSYYVNKLEHLLNQSVQDQLIADVPVGVLLSGGLDSSIITAIASKYKKNLRTFTATFPGQKKYDEQAHARLISDHFNTDHEELSVDSINPEIVSELTQYYDEPLSDPSMIPAYLVSKLVKKHCKVVLGGDGADELFLGYSSYERKIFQEKILKFIPLSIRSRASSIFMRLPFPRGQSLIHSLGLDFESLDSSFDPLLSSKELSMLLGRNINLLTTKEAHKKQIIDPFKEEDMLSKIHAGDFRNFLPNDILTKIDRATMGNSIEGRSPFLDKDIIDFSFNELPNNLKLHNGNKKYILKLLGQKILPDSFIFNRKQGFSFPIDEYFLKKDWQEYFCHKLETTQVDFFNKDFIFSKLKFHKRYQSYGRNLFSILFFLCWAERYLSDFDQRDIGV